MRVDNLNAMALKADVVRLCRSMPEQLACKPNCSSLSFRSHQKVKTSENGGISKLVNLGAGMDLERGERCEGVKNEGFIKKRNIYVTYCVTNMVTGRDLECAVNNEKICMRILNFWHRV